MKGYYFEPNDKVAHVENLEQVMIVKEIKRRTIFISTGQIDENKEIIKKKVNRIEGILCYWFEDKKYIEKPFHSELLVPYDVAEKGREEAEKWIDKKKISNSK